MPTTTFCKSMGRTSGGSSTITLSHSFCRPHPSPIWVPKDRSRTHRCGVTICPVYGVENLIKLYRLLSTVFSVLIFSHPSALQLLLCSFCSAEALCKNIYLQSLLSRSWSRAESASSLCATVVDFFCISLGIPSCGKDLVLLRPTRPIHRVL